MTILQQAQEQAAYLTKIRRHLHQNPEIGFEETETTALIRRELAAMGVELQPLAMDTGAVALIRGEKPGQGKVIALRADIDALPIQEQTGLPYASARPGLMHACGHDGHTAVLLGVAKLLNGMRDKFSGTVKLIFQPAEEQLYGARRMIEAGVLEDPAPEMILGLHGGTETPLGKVGVWSGPFMASADQFTATVIGVGAHGGYPHRGKDPLLTAAQAVVALQAVVSRETDAVDKVVLSICQFHAGSAFNVIPGEAVINGSVRCHDAKIREEIPRRMERIIAGVAAAYDCSYKFDYVFGIPAVANTPAVMEAFAAATGEALGGGNVVGLDRPLMGSEDFAYFLEKVPGGIFRLGIGSGQGSLHHPKFDFPDAAIPVGVAAMTQFALMQCK
ncbi:M20 metallopeptidase family protein [Anaeroselena agilis]|uniref:M20 family metallopeptidase n=1 Tax=Anaeroselena agilis TaxID=3063788 RepID=A0ABU3NZY5_9FIRM|nr:M20 family metallopeptidase [Selenomonadales bacterium 4137-cl]